MATLSSILVQRGAASMRAVEDAIARQVLHGGDLPTNLLEQSSVSEAMLTAILAESVGLEAAPFGKLPAPPASVLRLIPSDLAQGHNVFPLELRGRTLLLATAEPLSPAVEDDLGFALGVGIHQLIAPLVRVRQALADHYAVPLERRFVRLVAKLDKRAELSPSTAPPADHELLAVQPPRAVSILSPSFGTGVPSSEPDPDLAQRSSATGPITQGGRGRLEAVPATKTPFVADSTPSGALMPMIPPSPGVPQSLHDLAASADLAESRVDPDATPIPGEEPALPARPATQPPAAKPATVPPAKPATLPPPPALRPSTVPPPAAAKPATVPPAKPATLPPAKPATVPPAKPATLPPPPALRPPTVPPPAAPTEVRGIAPTEPAPSPAIYSVPGAKPARGTRALAGWVRQELQSEKASAPVDKTTTPELRGAWRPPRRKGPFTSAMAETELEAAATTDVVLDIFFAFASQFFEYAVLFVIHGDLAEGRDAAGSGADRARVSGVGVPLDLPSSLARARERRAPVITRLANEGLDADLQRDLSRGPRSPQRTVALIPIVVRNRSVALLYGDDGEGDVDLSSLGDVIALTGLVAASLERIALRKKLGVRPGEVVIKVAGTPTPVATPAASPVRPAATPGRVGGAAALVRAFALPVTEPSAAHVEAASSHDEAAEGRAPMLPPEAEAHAPDDDAAIAEPEALVAEAQASVTPSGDGSGETIPRVVARLAESAPEASSEQWQRSLGSHRTTRAGLGVPALDIGPTTEAEQVEQVEQVEHDEHVEHVEHVERDDHGEPEPLIPSEELTVPRRERQTIRELRYPLPESALIPEAESPTRPIERGRRGQAPVYLGRSKSSPEHSALEPLPSRPPPNAKAWTTFPSPPPPAPPAPHAPLPPLASLSTARARSDRPIPREEDDTPFAGSPTGASLSGGALLSAAVEPSRPSPVPSVIVDIGAEYNSLLHRVIEGGPGSQEAFKELVRHGEHLLQPLMAKFPGPLRIDRHRTRGELPAASQCGAILELIVGIRRPALPFVTVRLSSHDPEIRFWATHVLGELRYPEAANVLVPRLFDDDPAVRRIARRSAASLVNAGAAGGPILQGLDNITRSPDQPVTQRLIAIEAMGEIRAAAMVPSLIAVLEGSPEEIADAARRALLLIARQDFGRDVRRFREWWTRNANRHRIEWLIDALMHEQPSIRRAAGDELKLITKEYFGYYDDLPKRERERAQSLYRAWWEREGHARFS